MTVRDINKETAVVVAVAPAAALTATTTSSGIDLAGFRAASVVVVAGVATDGTFTPTIEDSDDNVTFAAVSASKLSGSFAAITAAADENVQEVGYLGTKRYIRVVLTETVASAGQFLTAFVIKGKPLKAPQ